MASRFKRLSDSVRDAGERDFKAGKPIDTFYTLKLKQHTEMMRASYEIGWRAAKAESRLAIRIFHKL